MALRNIINLLFNNQQFKEPVLAQAEAFAPVNIALSKYWGKRNSELNLPCNSSVSMSLNVGARTIIAQCDGPNQQQDLIMINNKLIANNIKLINFLNLFRPHQNFYFKIESYSDVPIAAGFASSASGYAALVLALDKFFGWQLSLEKLSILARLGSGSACRSIYKGFALWRKGQDETQGLDSFAIDLNIAWPDLRLGLCIVDAGMKYIDSSTAMQNCAKTSPLFGAWVDYCEQDCHNIVQALQEQNFMRLGELAEANALMMHAVMQASRPSIMYTNANTISLMQQVRALRQDGLAIYFTQDAGPNIKLLFRDRDMPAVLQAFQDRNLMICSQSL